MYFSSVSKVIFPVCWAMDESTITRLCTYILIHRLNKCTMQLEIHCVSNGNDISFPEQNIKQFMAAYHLGEMRITPKLHIILLEEHIVPWIRRWHVGVGFHSEQGAESIHALFNTLLRTYASTRNSTKKLERVMKEHYLKNTPQNLASIPVVNRRKKTK